MKSRSPGSPAMSDWALRAGTRVVRSPKFKASTISVPPSSYNLGAWSRRQRGGVRRGGDGEGRGEMQTSKRGGTTNYATGLLNRTPDDAPVCRARPRPRFFRPQSLQSFTPYQSIPPLVPCSPALCQTTPESTTPESAMSSCLSRARLSEHSSTRTCPTLTLPA